jgi:hypothetical protein
MASWALPLNNPHIVNLVADPKELEPYNQLYLHSWTMAHFERMLREFQRSVALEPLIPAGAHRSITFRTLERQWSRRSHSQEGR